ncbi:MAG TPA: molybdopterin-dependent oxidoreductase, partial [Nannocystaceae bacterium]|nr:molybdopterin-dependent oxidoreductase [Nannocystaceae bacterium]
FQIRAWELKATPTTCPGCATGCAVELHTKHEQAYRLVPRVDPDVNGHWMCDDGRLTYKQTDPEGRVLHARVDGEDVPLGHAIATAARRLRNRTRKIAVVFSATATTESNQALADLAELLEAERFIVGRPAWQGDDILRDSDANPNMRGALTAAGIARHEGELALELAGRAYEAVVFLDGTFEVSEVVRTSLESLPSICLADRWSPLAECCTVVLPSVSWAESLGSYVNRQGRLRVVQPAWRPEGDRRERADLLRELVLALGEKELPTSRERSRALAEEHDHDELRALSTDPEAARPTLLRFTHTRG